MKEDADCWFWEDDWMEYDGLLKEEVDFEDFTTDRLWRKEDADGWVWNDAGLDCNATDM